MPNRIENICPPSAVRLHSIFARVSNSEPSCTGQSNFLDQFPGDDRVIATGSHLVTQVLERTRGTKIVWRRRGRLVFVAHSPLGYDLPCFQNLNVKFSSFQLFLLQQPFQCARNFAGSRTNVSNNGKHDFICRGIEQYSPCRFSIFLRGNLLRGGLGCHLVHPQNHARELDWETYQRRSWESAGAREPSTAHF